MFVSLPLVSQAPRDGVWFVAKHLWSREERCSTNDDPHACMVFACSWSILEQCMVGSWWPWSPGRHIRRGKESLATRESLISRPLFVSGYADTATRTGFPCCSRGGAEPRSRRGAKEKRTYVLFGFVIHISVLLAISKIFFLFTHEAEKHLADVFLMLLSEKHVWRYFSVSCVNGRSVFEIARSTKSWNRNPNKHKHGPPAVRTGVLVYESWRVVVSRSIIFVLNSSTCEMRPATYRRSCAVWYRRCRTSSVGQVSGGHIHISAARVTGADWDGDVLVQVQCVLDGQRQPAGGARSCVAGCGRKCVGMYSISMVNIYR